MQDRIKVLCQNTSAEIEVEMGITLGELCAQLGIEGQYPILAAYVNNRLKELNSRLFKPAVVRFIDITHFEGYRVYQRTISFILHKAVWDIYGNRKFYIRHSLGRGFYCEFGDDKPITDEEIEALNAELEKIKGVSVLAEEVKPKKAAAKKPAAKKAPAKKKAEEPKAE